jgi:DNA polymerase III epsilon subunit-like protein
MTNNIIICFDFETGGLDIKTTEPIEIAAVAINPRTLSIVPDGTFYSLCKPTDFSLLQDQALAVNGKTRDQLQQAPEQEAVWRSFASFIKRFNSKGNGFMTAPIAAGKNIRMFDLPIFSRLCAKYGFADKNGDQNLFHRRKVYDLEDILEYWFHDSDELPDRKMDTLRGYFGLSKDGAHSAMVDTKQTAELIVRFLKVHRYYASRIPFRGACANNAVIV